MSTDDIEEQALKLEPHARAHLARILIASLDELTEAEIENLWIDEAIRRKDEIDRGTAKTIPAEEVIARVRAKRS